MRWGWVPSVAASSARMDPHPLSSRKMQATRRLSVTPVVPCGYHHLLFAVGYSSTLVTIFGIPPYRTVPYRQSPSLRYRNNPVFLHGSAPSSRGWILYRRPCPSTSSIFSLVRPRTRPSAAETGANLDRLQGCKYMNGNTDPPCA